MITRQTIALSTYLDIDHLILKEEGVLDITLGVDTPYFIDPRLVFLKNKKGVFDKSNEKIKKYFSDLIRIIKNSEDSPQLQEKAISMIAGKEPKGLSIGYGSKTDTGPAIPRSIAKKIVFSIAELIRVGIDDPELVEIMALFVDGYGPDSISDLSSYILYDDLCIFTQNVSKKLNIKTKKYLINNNEYYLPTHPFKNHQIIFVPLDYVSALPLASDWDGVQEAAQYNDKLRKEFSGIILPVVQEQLKNIRSLSKNEIEEFKKSFKKLLEIYRKKEVESYSTDLDEKGFYQSKCAIEEYAKKYNSTKKVISSCEDMSNLVRDIVNSFRRHIEDMGNSNLLYHRTKTHVPIKERPHREDVAQMIFNGIADVHCSYTNIPHARESKLSTGPVDFWFAKSRKEKVLVELKKNTNDIMHGYEEQLKKYEKGEKACYSFYVVIIVKKQLATKKKPITDIEVLKNKYEENFKNGIKSPELIIIDGLIYPSPSK
ncbi:MAG: DUF91 domain-containing protein [Candidatus Pacebacteria bacterium]|nr:DUF91 domain-containing protein [Candidatus Paceibacterota bacterium]